MMTHLKRFILFIIIIIFFYLYNLTPTALYRLSFVFFWKISDCLI